jgi:hypothetical protein
VGILWGDRRTVTLADKNLCGKPSETSEMSVSFSQLGTN